MRVFAAVAKFWVCLLVAYAGIHTLPAQDLQPTQDQALLQFKAIDFQNTPLDITVYFFGQKSKKVYEASAKVGKVLLPNQEIYTIYTQVAAERYDFATTTVPNQFYNVALQFDNSKKGTLYPTPLASVVKILLVNYQDKPIVEKISFKQEKTGKVFQGATNAEGILEMLLPANATYSISIGRNSNYSTITLPETPFYRVQKEIQFEGAALGSLQPSRDSVLFNLTYTDMQDKPVAGEVFTLFSTSTQKKFQTLPTDKAGKVQIKVPIGDTYIFSAKYVPDFVKQKVESKPDLYVLALNLQSISSADWEQYLARLAEKEKQKEAEWQAKQEAMKQEMAAYEREVAELRLRAEKLMQEEVRKGMARYKADSLQAIRKFTQDSLAYVKNNRILDSLTYLQRKRAQEIARQDSLAGVRKKQIADSLFALTLTPIEKRFAEKGYSIGTDPTVSEVLKRNPQWKNKVIAVDVTGSMYPYMKQLELWYKLQFTMKEKAQFVLFNDGNTLPDVRKQVGKTGGLYLCTDGEVGTLEKVLAAASKAGNGGDSQENDIEAILHAQNTFNPKEIILIADMSHVRDMALLAQVKVPVRVVLCGVVDIINVQYLELAYRTGGSLHTIEEDISDMTKLAEGKVIQINGIKYQLIKGNFVCLKGL